MEQNKIWDYFQNTEHRDDFLMSAPRYRFLARKIPRSTKALNIGVGRGGLERILAQQGTTVSCLDPSEASIKAIREQLGMGDRAQVGYSQNMPFSSDTFDFVIMSEVLEHLDDSVMMGTLQEVQRVLLPSGRFIGTVPANEVLENLQVICPKCGEIFHKWGHVQSFSREKLQRVLADKGFKNITIEYQAFPDWSRSGPMNFMKSSVRYILGRMGKSIALPSLYFNCTLS